MSSRLKRLLHNYQNHISVPWQKGLAGVQKVIFVVYDKTDELRFRARLTELKLRPPMPSTVGLKLILAMPS